MRGGLSPGPCGLDAGSLRYESSPPNTHTEVEIVGMAPILRKNEVELLKQTSVLIEGILETLEAASEPHASKGVREGLRDLNGGR